MNTNTGQAVGILTKWWTPLFIDSYISPGILSVIGGSICTSPGLFRVIVMGGQEVDSLHRSGVTFVGEETEVAYLLRYLAIDITLWGKNGPPTIVTIIQSVDDKKRSVNLYQYQYIPSGMSPKILADGIRAWDLFAKILDRFALSEFWGRLTGQVTPSCGRMKGGTLYVTEQCFHLGSVRHDNSFCSPISDGIDRLDLGRIEKALIHNHGIHAEEILSPNIKHNKDIVEKYLQAFARTTSPDEWRLVTQAILSKKNSQPIRA